MRQPVFPLRLALADGRTDDGQPTEEDAFASVEKTLSQKAQALNAAQRLEALEAVNDDRWSDPYEHSKRLRRSFREEKKVRQVVEKQDEAIRDRYGLSREIKLESEKPEEAREAARVFKNGRRAIEAADEGKKRRRVDSAATTPADSLKSRLLAQTRQSSDPFASLASSRPTLLVGVRR